MVIPETLDGYIVTGIGDWAFESCIYITDVTIPETVISIGYDPFITTLKGVHIESIEHWLKISFKDEGFFYSCGQAKLYVDGELLEHLVIPEGVTELPDYAFCGYKPLKSVMIPASMKIMGSNAFNNSGLKDVYVESLEAWINTCNSTIKEYYNFIYEDFHPMICAENFYVDGELLVDVVIPNEITEIPVFAFYNIKSIKSVTFNSGITKVKSGSFSFCSNLKEVFVPDVDTWLKVCGITSHLNVKIETIYIDEKEVVDFVVPEGTTSLPAYMFYNYDKLENVTINKDVRSMGKSCFEECDNLKSIYVDSLETWLNIDFEGENTNPIGMVESFYIDGKILTDPVIPEGITVINDYAFKDCDFIRSITFPSTLTTVGKYAFQGCDNIESVYAPSLESWFAIDFVTPTSNPSLNAKLYINGELLEHLVVPEGVNALKRNSLHGYDYLKSITVSGEPLEICINALYSVEGLEIYADTVEDWLQVTYTDDPDDGFTGFYKEIGYYATLHIGGKVVTELIIPEGAVIPAHSFAGLKTLTKVIIPATAKVEDYAFEDSSVKEIFLGSRTKKGEAGMIVSSQSFRDCNKLEKATFGYGVKEIKKEAFTKCKNLKSIFFSTDVERIGEAAFKNAKITSLSLPSNIKYIGKSAFESCSFLETVILGDKNALNPSMDFNDKVFYNCPELKEVTINSGIFRFGYNAFKESTNIENVYINDFVSYLDILFYSENSNPVRFADNMYIEGKIPKNIVIPEGVKSVCEYAFAGRTTLESVKFPSTLIRIDNGAFENCTNLSNVKFPEFLVYIDNEAFYGCKKLKHVELGKRIKDLGYSAFGCCTSLEVIYMYPEQLNIGKSAFYECNNIKVILYTGTEEAWLKLLNENKRETGLENIAVFYSYRPESMLAPEGFTAKPTANSVILNWTKINGVSGYRVFVKKDSGWKALTTTNKNAYTATQLQTGTKYTFAVKAYINTGALVLWSPNYSVVDTAAPTTKPSKVTAAQNSSAIKLTWAKCSGATGYRIFFKSGNVWRIAVNATAATSHTFTGLKPGAKFTFAIRPYIINGSSVIWSPYTEFTTATMPSAVTAKASSPSKGSLSLSWNAVNGADGYRVYYKVGNGSYKLYKTYSSVQNLTFRNLKSGTKYTFAVRAGIRTSGGNIFGGYNTATVTVK